MEAFLISLTEKTLRLEAAGSEVKDATESTTAEEIRKIGKNLLA